MKKEEFMLQKSESERMIRRRWVPVGMIYSVRVASFLGFLYCGWVLWKYNDPLIYKPLSLAVGVLSLLFRLFWHLCG